MSLINEMLRDLDARENVLGPQSVASEGSAELSPDDSDKRRLMPVLLGLVFAVVVGFFLVQHLTTDFWSSSQRLSEELAQPVLAASASDVKPESQVIEPGAVVIKDTHVHTVEIEKAEKDVMEIVTAQMNSEAAGEKAVKDKKINELLSKAQVALTQNRLSLPQGKSAYDLYRQVIAMDAENLQALSGLEQIKNRYSELIASALEEKKPERAEQLVSRMENLPLGFETSQLSFYRDQIQTAYRDQVQAQQQLAADVAAAPETNPTNTDEEAKSDRYLAINKTTISRELALAQEAQQLLAQGRGMEAARQLESFIANNTTTNLSRILLFDYYFSQTRISEARALMEPMHAMAASTRVYMQARLAMLSSGNMAAITMLEKEKPEPSSAEIYNALLAGLYQKEKAHSKAAVLYASLIETNPSNVTYWLGMGVSRDALGDYQPALNAYNVVITHKNLDDSVRGFVKGRIQALSSQKVSSQEVSSQASSQDLAEAGIAW